MQFENIAKYLYIYLNKYKGVWGVHTWWEDPSSTHGKITDTNIHASPITDSVYSMATEAYIVTSECTHVYKVSPEIHARDRTNGNGTNQIPTKNTKMLFRGKDPSCMNGHLRHYRGRGMDADTNGSLSNKWPVTMQWRAASCLHKIPSRLATCSLPLKW